MTDRERMVRGLLYDPGDKDILSEQQGYQQHMYEFNALGPMDFEEQEWYMKLMFAECGENTYIQRPFYANWGGHNVHLGSNIYMNFNTTFVDDGHIYIGDWVQFGPNVTIATAGHPVLPELRSGAGIFLQYNKDVHIEEGVWVGAGAVICPGVTIGKNAVIGAGSVVTKDIPADVVAAGSPCRVIREIEAGEGGRDRKYFFRDESIDWEEVNEKYTGK